MGRYDKIYSSITGTNRDEDVQTEEPKKGNRYKQYYEEIFNPPVAGPPVPEKPSFQKELESGAITTPNFMDLEKTPRIQQVQEFAEERGVNGSERSFLDDFLSRSKELITHPIKSLKSASETSREVIAPTLEQFPRGLASGATFGLSEKLLPKSEPKTQLAKDIRTSAELLGTVAPWELAASTVGHLAKGAVKASPLVKNVVKQGAAGLGFTGLEAGSKAIQGEPMDWEHVGKSAALNVGLGAGGELATAALGKALSSPQIREGLSNLVNRKKTIAPVTESAEPVKQNWFERLFGKQGVGIIPGSQSGKELIDTHIVGRSRKAGPLIDRLGETVSNTGQNLVDRFTPFKLISKEAYDAAMDSTRANNLANITIKDKFVDLEGNVLGKSLKEVYSTVPRGEKNIADRYVIMRDAATGRMDRGIKVYGDKPWFPKTADEAIDMVADLEQKYPWLNKFGEDWNQFNRNRQDLWVSSGIASQELIDTLRFTNPDYAPMFRQQDKTSLKGKLAFNSSKSGFSGQKAPVQRAVGSTKKIVDPAQGMIETTGSSYNAMMRNRAMQDIYKAVEADPEKYKGVLEIVEETADMKQSTLKAINDAMAENGPEGVSALLNDELNGIFKKAKQATGKNDATVTVMIQGEPVKMRVFDPSLLKAIEGISPEQLGAVVKAFNTVSKSIKYAATGGLAPLQGLKLAFRDLPIALTQSKDKKRFIADVSHALISQVADWLPNYVPGAQRLGNLARQYYRAGGGYEAYLKGDSKLRTMSADLTKDPILSGRNLLKTARKTNPFRPLQGFGDAMENIPRIAAFAAEMRKNGWRRDEESVRAAVEAAREATVNWSRRGFKGAEIEAFLPYSNAAVQGTYRLVKRFKEQPFSAIALVMGVAGAKIAAYEQFKDDPDYQQRSRFEKGIPISKTADGKFNTLPVEPTEAFIADQILHFYKWATGEEGGPGVKETIQEGAEAFLPKYASGPASAFTSPGRVFDAKAAMSNSLNGSSFEPLRALDTGKNFFGGDVIPREYQGLPTDLQYSEMTSGVGKWAAEHLGIDAFTFDYLGQKFGGDVAKVGLPMTSAVGKVDPTGNMWDETLAKLKLLEDPVMKNRISDDFYSYASSVSQAKESFNRKDVPLPIWYQSAYDEVTSTKKDSLASRISELNTMKKDIERDTTISARQRADELREVQRQINLIRIQGIKRLEELGVPKTKGR